ncbi:hypothetical protein PR048_009720 [Dryococelus australis]|uniref:Integrase catalytic domain-containing protein n=1 Tax=Dryococelus australis TaxID=614101 RepID=A0ABQ9I137_9NEOP|nr:hypothetical protein PR048_009720 [Dryococelus australis]
MTGSHIFIPRQLCTDILSKIYKGFIVKCHRRAQGTVLWPNCKQCLEERSQHGEPLQPTTLPGRPRTLVRMDIFELINVHYLVVQDSLSRFLQVMKLGHLMLEAVISRVKNIFARHRIPETVHTDGGTQYTAKEVQLFAKEYGFMHVTISPKFPQSISQAESAVKIAKRIPPKEIDPNLGLLVYRATPLETGFSPAELLFGRKLCTTIPQKSSSLQTHWDTHPFSKILNMQPAHQRDILEEL